MKNFDPQVQIKEKQIDLSNEDSLKSENSVAEETCNGLNSMTQYDFNVQFNCSNNLHLDSRSQSLPDCSNNDCQLHLCQENNECSNSPDRDNSLSSKSESWFKTFRTWPERYEKLKDVEPSLSPSSPMNSSITQEISNFNYIDNSNVKNKLSFNEALQNISLAYSPITKKLHLVDNPKTCETDCKIVKDLSNNDESHLRKLGHRRNEAGSFSSTISSWSAVSDPSTSGSLIGSEDRSLSSFDVSSSKFRRKSLTNFFSKHVFTWKGAAEPSTTSSVWKIFTKQSSHSNHVSPVHGIASSSALIQHERPSNLPAKTQEEEQRHKDEYKAILVAAKKKEAQTTAAKYKQQKQQLKIEEQQAYSTRHFLQHVLPNWNTMCSNKKTLELWWQGIPSSVRGKVWQLAIGNELNLTPQLYDICVNRAQNRLNNVEISINKSCVDQESSMDVIQLDISRTFPQLGIFQEGGPYSEALHSLLAAYVCYRPDVGYVQGMSYIAAILILNMEPCDAFICFSNLLNQPLHLSAFTLNQDKMQRYYNAYEEVFYYNLPKLHSHFTKSGLTPDLYLLDWIYTIFAKAMPLDIACRVWDVFLRDGYEFIFRTGLGILNLYQDTLMHMDFLQGAQFLTHLPEDISADCLFKCIQTVNTTIGKQSFSQIIEKCS